MRMDGEAVKFDERAIIVGQQVAKKRSRRVVEMCDALYAWLSPLKLLKGKIVDAKEFRDNMDEFREAAKLESWPHNGLRHSFGSYHLAFYGDAVKTAQQMGHRSSDVVHNHYKALVLKQEAEKFWGLRPKPSKETKPPVVGQPKQESPAPESSRPEDTAAPGKGDATTSLPR
jgi:integrase